MPPAQPRVHYAKSGDIHIAYQVFGAGKVNLVLTPGIISHISHNWNDPNWKKWLEGLGAFARTAVFDKRGTGLSDRSAGVPTFEERMDDIRSVMDAAGFADAVLVGFSDGVGMSALFAATYPSRTRGLVLYGGEAKGSWAPDHPWEPTSDMVAELLERLERTYGTAEMAERWVASLAPSLEGDQAFTEWIVQLLHLGCTPGAAVSLGESNLNMDVRDALPEITSPTLVIHPTHDRNVDVRGGRYLAKHIRGARLFEFRGKDHWFFVNTGQRNRILREIERFAANLKQPAGPQRKEIPRVEAKRRMAVLPLANLGGDPRDEFFVDGMTEELITAVSQIPDLRVIARTSIMRYKGTDKSAKEIGRELGVDTLVEGSVRKSSSGIRVSVQLISADTEEHIWAQTFDQAHGDVLRLQAKISSQVARRLKLKLSQRQEDSFSRGSDAEAHTLYLRARYHLNQRSEEGIKQAIGYFERATKKDPEFSLALVGLADSYQISALYGYTSPAEVYPKARDLAFRALKAGGAEAEAYASLGEFLMHYSYDWAGASRNLERALQVNQSYAMAHIWRSTNYAVLGQLGNALVESQRGSELDPFSVVSMNEHAKNYYYARRYYQAAAEFTRAIEAEPGSAYLHKGLAETYAIMSRPDEATREMERALTISGRGALYLDSAASVFALSHQEEKSRRVLAEAERLRKRRYVPSYGRAAAHAALGDHEEALRMLRSAYDDHGWLIWVGVDPVFRTMRGDPSFRSLLRKMNLTAEDTRQEPPGALVEGQSSGGFEFESDRTRTIFEQLASDFVKDYMLRRLMEERAGWRTTAEIARETRIPVSSLYPKGKETAAPFRELWKRGLVEMRVSPGERGRGGEVTKIRVAYERRPIREYVNNLARVGKRNKQDTAPR